ncbi:MAG: hypothetical protein HYV27_09050 [Candidatus Hydrogenedentes bacterium]|nr:hypothetical protein [Candidatus Hydrogenedentota bacterium]
MKLRPGAQRIEVYNEGLTVYLHDPANAQAILEANPQSILYPNSDVEATKDKALKKLLGQGAIVVDVLMRPRCAA